MRKRVLRSLLPARNRRKSFKLNQISARPWCVLGLIDAALGRKAEALREGRRAVELDPVKKDAVSRPLMIRISGDDRRVGWRQRSGLRTACRCCPTSEHLSYGELKLLPWWDPLRGDPRFEKIVASLAPK